MNAATKDLYSRVWLFRNAAAVRRCHTMRVLKEKNLAEHSHGVAMLLVELYRDQDGSMPSSAILTAALVHDLSEIETGDIPAPCKWAHQGFSAAANAISTQWEEKYGVRIELTEEEQRLLRFCDACEFALSQIEEYLMGNSFSLVPLRNIVTSLHSICSPVAPSVNGKSDSTSRLYSAIALDYKNIMLSTGANKGARHDYF